jgi:hypothetical protein
MISKIAPKSGKLKQENFPLYNSQSKVCYGIKSLNNKLKIMLSFKVLSSEIDPAEIRLIP